MGGASSTFSAGQVRGTSSPIDSFGRELIAASDAHSARLAADLPTFELPACEDASARLLPRPARLMTIIQQSGRWASR